MARGLRSPASLAKSLGGGRGKSLFKITGVLFNTDEIYSYLDKRSKVTFESIGRALRRDMQRSLKLAKRYTSINQIPTNDPYYKSKRVRARIQEQYWMRGEADGPPRLPFRASKPGKIPKIRSADSPLKRGIIFEFNPDKIELLCGAAKMTGTKGVAPNVLEYGGMSNGSRIKQRGYVRRSYEKLSRNGKINQIFSRRMRV